MFPRRKILAKMLLIKSVDDRTKNENIVTGGEKVRFESRIHCVDVKCRQNKKNKKSRMPLRNRKPKNNADNFPMPVHYIKNKFSHQTKLKTVPSQSQRHRLMNASV